MCNKCNRINYNYENYSQKAEQYKIQKKAESANMLVGTTTALASMLLNTFFENCSTGNKVNLYTDPVQLNYATEDSGAPVGDATAEQNVETTTEAKTELTDEQIKAEIENLLKDRIPNLDTETMNELIEKYKQIKANNDNYSNDLLAVMLTNYVKGKINHQIATNWQKLEFGVLEIAPEAGSKARATALSNSATAEEKIDLTKDENNISIEKLRELSLQYLEYADTNGDKVVDLLEFFRKDLITYYQIYENLNINDATKKAEDKIKELNLNTGGDVIALAQTLNPEALDDIGNTLLCSVIQIGELNQDGHIGLNLEELMAYHATIANFNTEDNQIDAGDYSLFNSSLTEDILIKLPDGQIVNQREYSLKNYYEAIKKFNAKQAG